MQLLHLMGLFWGKISQKQKDLINISFQEIKEVELKTKTLSFKFCWKIKRVIKIGKSVINFYNP